MPELESFECEQCGESFRALPGSNAAEAGYCSPRCESAGKGLA